MEINTLFKKFDAKVKRAGGIMTGNAITDVQVSLYVRGRDNTECNGTAFRPGELRDKDLQGWVERGTPTVVLERVKHHTAGHASVVLYQFFFYENERKHVIGHLITCPPTDGVVVVLDSFPQRDNAKYLSAFEACEKAVTAPRTHIPSSRRHLPPVLEPVYIW